VGGSLIDKSARPTEPNDRPRIEEPTGVLYLRPVEEIEELCSGRWARD
jgi:hypothetical protein